MGRVGRRRIDHFGPYRRSHNRVATDLHLRNRSEKQGVSRPAAGDVARQIEIVINPTLYDFARSRVGGKGDGRRRRGRDGRGARLRNEWAKKR